MCSSDLIPHSNCSDILRICNFWGDPRPCGLGGWPSHRWSGVAEIEDIWEAYWRIYTSCIESGFFDILAHPDLPKKFGHRPSGSLKRFYAPAIEAAKEADVCIEINTAGWRKDCNEQYPEKEFLEMMLEAEIPISINSDAHSPIDVGMDFEKAAKLAYEIGYNKTVRFNKRQRTEIPFSI